MTTPVAKLSGTWYNQLGSEMKLVANADGSLSGQYKSAVGEATDFYTLKGRFDTAPPSTRGISLGWAVTFYNHLRNAHSTATWSGQYFWEDGRERIVTQWLLTTSSTPEDIWSSARVGNDTFYRTRHTIGSLKARL